MTLNDLFSPIYRASIKDFRRNLKSTLMLVTNKADAAVAIMRYNRPVAIIVSPAYLNGMATEMDKLIEERDELYDEINDLKGKLHNASQVAEEEVA